MALEFRCADAGVACKATTRAETKDELLARVSEHAQAKHGVELNDTLIDYALTQVRTTGEQPPATTGT